MSSPPMMVTISRLTAYPSSMCWSKRQVSRGRRRIAEWAIGKGCHVVMASKEAGIVVGPILNRRQNRTGSSTPRLKAISQAC